MQMRQAFSFPVPSDQLDGAFTSVIFQRITQESARFLNYDDINVLVDYLQTVQKTLPLFLQEDSGPKIRVIRKQPVSQSSPLIRLNPMPIDWILRASVF